MMGKMKVKMKVTDEDLNDFSFRGFTWLEQCTMHFNLKNYWQPCRGPHGGETATAVKTIPQTSLQLARYRENDTATAAIPPPRSCCPATAGKTPPPFIEEAVLEGGDQGVGPLQ